MKKLITFLLLSVCINIYGYKISENGKSFIKKKEGLILKKDKHNQIGYGHLMIDKKYNTITKEKAEQLFNKDIIKTNNSINKLLNPIKLNFSQNFIDGFGSLIYNCGETKVINSTFYKRLLRSKNLKDLEYSMSAIKYLKSYNKGLKSRRIDEYNLMRN